MPQFRALEAAAARREISRTIQNRKWLEGVSKVRKAVLRALRQKQEERKKEIFSLLSSNRDAASVKLFCYNMTQREIEEVNANIDNFMERLHENFKRWTEKRSKCEMILFGYNREMERIRKILHKSQESLKQIQCLAQRMKVLSMNYDMIAEKTRKHQDFQRTLEQMKSLDLVHGNEAAYLADAVQRALKQLLSFQDLSETEFMIDADQEKPNTR